MTKDTEAESPQNKVATVIGKYDMGEIGHELESKWVGEHGDGKSVRELTAFFNKRVIEAALLETGTTFLESDIEEIYELLDSESPSTDLEIQERFNTADIDLEALKQDLVSHQTMYRYLKQIRGAEKENQAPSVDDQIASTKSAVQKLQSRITAIVTSNLDSLSKKEGFVLGNFEATLTITITCRDCNTSRNFFELLENKGCECELRN